MEKGNYNYFDSCEYKGYIIKTYCTYKVVCKDQKYGEQYFYDIIKDDEIVGKRRSINEAQDYIDNFLLS